MDERPYLSIVVAARNDNYGGDFVSRLQNCINWYSIYAEELQLPSEFIIVNYNPVPTEKPLQEQLNIAPCKWVRFRIITVPNTFHESISDNGVRKRLPLYEYVAKNIGIRRAKGEYILSANPDVLFEPHILGFIAEKKLNAADYYRADRCNFKKLERLDPHDLPGIRNNITDVCAKGKDFDISFGGPLVAKICYYKVRSFLFRKYYFILRDYPFLAKLTRNYVAEEYMCYKLHTNAAGDFLMMYHSNWEKLKGHPENTLLPVHVDSLSVAVARYSGLKEHVFFYPVYHQEHGSRFRAKSELDDVKEMYAKFETDARWMEKNKAPIIYNDDAWGFPSEKFDEIVIGKD